MRRSALDFRGGMQSMSLAQLSTILAVTGQPLFADFAGTRFVQLYLYAHRVDGLQPGVYRFWQDRCRVGADWPWRSARRSRGSKSRARPRR